MSDKLGQPVVVKGNSLKAFAVAQMENHKLRTLAADMAEQLKETQKVSCPCQQLTGELLSDCSGCPKQRTTELLDKWREINEST